MAAAWRPLRRIRRAVSLSTRLPMYNIHPTTPDDVPLVYRYLMHDTPDAIMP